MTQKAELEQWFSGVGAGLLPALDTVAQKVERAVSRLRFPCKKEEMAEVIREAVDDLRQPELLRKKLIIRSFSEPDKREIHESLDQIAAYLPGLLCEYSDLFAVISQPTKGARAAAAAGGDFLAGAKRIASCYKKEILPQLLLEKDLISGHLRRLDEISLSCGRPGAVKGEARHMLQSPSRERRMRAYRSLAGRMARYKNEVEKEFVELHGVRRDMAGRAGFKTYFDYAVTRSGLTEETRARVTAFRQLIQEHLAPLAFPIRAGQWKRLAVTDPKPWDLMYTAPFGLPVIDLGAYPLEKTYLKALSYLLADEVPHFESMMEAGSLSFHVTGEPGEGAASFDYCEREAQEGVLSSYFPDLDQSCLLLPHMPQEWFASVVFAETGSLLLEQSAGQELPCPLPMAEARLITGVARTSMSFLSQRIWNLFYGNMARYAREYELTGLALDLSLYCALDEMEEFLSRARVTNLDVFRHAWGEIARRYHLPGTADELPPLIPTEDLWLYSPSLWSHPLTGIFRALAAVTVLGTLPLSRHYQVLETCFEKLIKNHEQTGDPFARLIQAGYPSPFEEETVQRARFAIVDYLGL